jgi:hypothetical protein
MYFKSSYFNLSTIDMTSWVVVRLSEERGRPRGRAYSFGEEARGTCGSLQARH